MKDRRAFLRKAACLTSGAIAGMAMLPLAPLNAQQQPVVYIVSHERLLRETAIARLLRKEEQRMTEVLQRQVDQAKLALAGEEAELASARDELSKEAFEQRIKDFDARMRRARQLTQERSGILQKGFQEARAKFVAAIPVVIEELRIESGATLILNADQVLAAERSLDLTDRAIRLFDSIAPTPAVPVIDLTLPVTELVTPEAKGEDKAQQ